jgi:hypothetical protein
MFKKGLNFEIIDLVVCSLQVYFWSFRFFCLIFCCCVWHPRRMRSMAL